MFKLAEIQGDVAAVQDDVVVVAADVERNSVHITTLATTGTWCAVQDYWNTVPSLMTASSSLLQTT